MDRNKTIQRILRALPTSAIVRNDDSGYKRRKLYFYRREDDNSESSDDGRSDDYYRKPPYKQPIHRVVSREVHYNFEKFKEINVRAILVTAEDDKRFDCSKDKRRSTTTTAVHRIATDVLRAVRTILANVCIDDDAPPPTIICVSERYWHRTFNRLSDILSPLTVKFTITLSSSLSWRTPNSALNSLLVAMLKDEESRNNMRVRKCWLRWKLTQVWRQKFGNSGSTSSRRCVYCAQSVFFTLLANPYQKYLLPWCECHQKFAICKRDDSLHLEQIIISSEFVRLYYETMSENCTNCAASDICTKHVELAEKCRWGVWKSGSFAIHLNATQHSRERRKRTLLMEWARFARRIAFALPWRHMRSMCYEFDMCKYWYNRHSQIVPVMISLFGEPPCLLTLLDETPPSDE